MARGPIIVVGGGPAGATAALLLARAGERVELLERRSDGTGKCCGGCLAPRAIPILRRLGLEALVRRIAAGATRSWRLHDPRGRVLLDESLGEREGLVVERAALDAALRAEAISAGARLRRGVSIEQAVHERPALLIGADGVGSGVARCFGLANGAGQSPSGARRRESGAPRARSLGASWTVDAGRANGRGAPEGVISIHLARGGYIGVVGAGERVLVASLHDRNDSGPPVRPMDAVRAWIRENDSLAWIDLERAPMLATGPLPWRPSEISRGPRDALPGVALVGDAAGYEEPFTGEGMAWAFESAELLARCVLASGNWSDAAAREYAEAHHRQFALRRMRLRAIVRVGRAVSSRPALGALLRAAGVLPLVSGSFVRSVVAA